MECFWRNAETHDVGRPQDISSIPVSLWVLPVPLLRQEWLGFVRLPRGAFSVSVFNKALPVPSQRQELENAPRLFYLAQMKTAKSVTENGKAESFPLVKKELRAPYYRGVGKS